MESYKIKFNKKNNNKRDILNEKPRGQKADRQWRWVSEKMRIFLTLFPQRNNYAQQPRNQLHLICNKNK